MALTARLALALALAAATIMPACAQAPSAQAPSSPERPALPGAPPAPFQPDPATGPVPDPVSDTWIFSGALQTSHESFSGTLVTSKSETQFELKLAGGATCTGGSLKGEVGLVRLSEITCTDERTMRALFVPQGGEALRVFGHVGEERFSTSAHLLGTEAIPDKKQSAAPKAPPGDPTAPSTLPNPPAAPSAPGKDSPG